MNLSLIRVSVISMSTSVRVSVVEYIDSENDNNINANGPSNLDDLHLKICSKNCPGAYISKISFVLLTHYKTNSDIMI